MSDQSATPSKRKERKGSRLASWWVVPSLLIFSLLVGMWDVSLRVAQKHEHVPDHHRASRDVERLIKDTTALLHAAHQGGSNGSGGGGAEVTLSQSVQSDLKRVQGDQAEAEHALQDLMQKNKFLQAQLDAIKTAKATGTSSEAAAAAAPGVTVTPAITATAGGASGEHDKWLVIGINTVARKGGHDYLIRTLYALARELPADPSDLLYGRVLVLVANVQDQFHEVFFKAKDLFGPGTHAKAVHFQFIDRESFVELPNPHPNSRDQGNPNMPGHAVRKQTRDVVSVMREATKVGRRGKYYLFLEDDMLLCPSGFAAIQYMLHKSALYHPDWLAVKASYGMNGIFLHGKDVQPFSEYLERHQARRPPDHLVVEWFAGETPESKRYKHHGGKGLVRANIGFKYNLFDHIGTSSTLRPADQVTDNVVTPPTKTDLYHHFGSNISPTLNILSQTSFPRCYDRLAEPIVFKVEAFDPRECPHDDIWPCDVGVATTSNHDLIDWSSLHTPFNNKKYISLRGRQH